MSLTFFLMTPSRAWCPSVQVLARRGQWERSGLFQLPAGRILAALRAAGPTQHAAWARPVCGAHTGKAAAPPSHFEGTGVWWAEWPASDQDRKKRSLNIISCYNEGTYCGFTVQAGKKHFTGKMQTARGARVRNSADRKTSRAEESPLRFSH